MPWLKTPLAVVLLLFLSGCVSRQVLLLETLPLPAADKAPCCWQALMSAEIEYQGEQQQLLAALAFEKDEYSLALLNSVGQRLYSLHYKNGQLQHFQSPLLPEAIPDKVLLAMHHLTWWPLSSWPFTSAEQSGSPRHGWMVSSQAESRQLRYKQQPMLQVAYAQPVTDHIKPPAIGERYVVQHPKLDFSMELITRQWQAL